MKQVKRILCITILLLIVIGTMISTYATNYAFFAYDDEGVYRALKLENSISPYFYYYHTIINWSIFINTRIKYIIKGRK